MTDTGADPHPYLAGLVLTGRRVVVVGGGHVAQRRVPALIASGGDVTVVSPEVTPAIEGLAGELTLVLRDFPESDLDGAWYVVAATDDPQVNARVVAAAALDRFPAGPLQAALEALGQEIDSSPRLVIRTGDLDDANRARIEQLCADAGFSGVVAFREGADLPPAAFQLEWADGRAAFEPEAAFARMREALASALAAEAGHAESITPAASMEGRP